MFFNGKMTLTFDVTMDGIHWCEHKIRSIPLPPGFPHFGAAVEGRCKLTSEEVEQIFIRGVLKAKKAKKREAERILAKGRTLRILAKRIAKRTMAKRIAKKREAMRILAVVADTVVETVAVADTVEAVPDYHPEAAGSNGMQSSRGLNVAS